MANAEKLRSVAVLKQMMQQASALYFLDHTRVGANDINTLRRRLGNQGVAVQVVKNRLALIALTELGLTGEFRTILRGPTSMLLAGEDPVAPARTVRDTMRRLTALRFKGAYL
ncbi:50S ribosomal protein L10, partial [candidate division WOR-3 bacterium]|nr:50S ribosomal protein L10 [candidate division WOR-3 bacterium]